MNQTEKFISALESAGENGVTVDALRTLLGGKMQAVHTAAHSAKKKGYNLQNSKGLYILKGKSSNVPATTERKDVIKVPVPTTVMGITVDPKLFEDMDHNSKLDLIEQLRRAQLHLDIARSISNSFKLAQSMKEKL